MVTDVFPALALALEPPEPDVMRRPPRHPDAAILSHPFLAAVTGYALLITAATLGVFLWALEIQGRDAGHAVTMAFTTLALAQLFHVLNARSPRPVILSRRLFANPWVWGALAVSVGLQLAAVYTPFLSRVLHTQALGLEDWALVLIASAVPLVVGQLVKPLSSAAAPLRPPLTERG